MKAFELVYPTHLPATRTGSPRHPVRVPGPLPARAPPPLLLWTPSHSQPAPTMYEDAGMIVNPGALELQLGAAVKQNLSIGAVQQLVQAVSDIKVT